MVKNWTDFFSERKISLDLLGIDTAKHAADHLDVYLLHALNKMLEDSGHHESKYPEAVRSSELNLDQLKHVIKETYYQLDQNLRKMVKDDSGCVCVRNVSTIIFFRSH